MRAEPVAVNAEVMGKPEILIQQLQATEGPRGVQTILLVEDENRVRRVMSAVLQMAGYAVLEAENAEEALRQVGQCGQRLQLLITDVVLPGMSGRELTQQLQERFPGMKAILISGYGESVALLGTARTRDISYLPKPFSATSLMDVVAGVLQPEVRGREIRETRAKVVSGSR